MNLLFGPRPVQDSFVFCAVFVALLIRRTRMVAFWGVGNKVRSRCLLSKLCKLRHKSTKPTWDGCGAQGLPPEFLTIIDEDRRVLFTNHVQPGVEPALGLSCLDFVPPDQHEKFQRAINNTIATGLPWHCETQAAGPNGEISYYSVWATLLSGDPKSCRVALIGTDISHTRRVEEELALSDENDAFPRE